MEKACNITGFLYPNLFTGRINPGFRLANYYAMEEQIMSGSGSKPSAISRKEFLSMTGKSITAGAAGLAISGIASDNVYAQMGPKVSSPPAQVPPGVTDPIVLEQWKSDVDQQSGPTPTPLPPENRVRYAVVGLGHLALEEILPAIGNCKKSKLTALVSGSPEKLKKVAAQYGVKPENCYNYQTYDQLRNNKEVDVIYVVLPNALHKEFVVRGAKAGKHILCEKPMATSSKDCREMIDACNTAGVKLMVAYRIQYEPHNRKLREMVQKKQYGTPKLLVADNSQSSANPQHWRHKLALAGGGSLPDIGLYCLNTSRFVLGEEPTEVFAYKYSTPGNPLFTEVEELMSWQMRFPSGVVANCTADYNVHESRYYRMLCDKGWLDMEKAFAYHGQKMGTARAEGKMERKEEVSLMEKNQFATEMDHFSGCVMQNKKPFTPGEEGLQDHIIMEAIYQSAKEGKPVQIKGLLGTGYRGPEPEED